MTVPPGARPATGYRARPVTDLPCQERTHDELRESLTEALSEALEFNRSEARAAAGDNYREEKVAVA